MVAEYKDCKKNPICCSAMILYCDRGGGGGGNKNHCDCMLELTEMMVKAKERKQLVKTLLSLIYLAPNYTDQSFTKTVIVILLLLLPLLLFEEQRQPEVAQ